MRWKRLLSRWSFTHRAREHRVRSGRRSPHRRSRADALVLEPLEPRVMLAGDLGFAHALGGAGLDFGQAVTVDDDGNFYITGQFSGTANFSTGPGTTNLVSDGDMDVFIAKYDSTGGLVWARKIGGSSTQGAWGIDRDDAGNVYVSGFFGGTTDFDPGPGTFNLTSQGANVNHYDAFVVKLDSGGDFVWAVSFAGDNVQQATGIAVDGPGNVHVTGFFMNTVDFDPGPGVFNLASNGGNDIFIVKLDTDGNFVWARSFGGTAGGGDEAYGIGLDAAGNVYTAGVFIDPVDFDPGPGNVVLGEQGNQMFLHKLDADGNFVWARVFGGVDNLAAALAVDAAGNAHVTGYFSQTADFDPGPGVTTLTNQAGLDAFIAKFDAAGNLVWARNVGGNAPFNDATGTAIALDADGNVYTGGAFNQTVDFDPGAGTFNRTSNGDNDAFVLKLDANGNFVWAGTMGGAGNDVLAGLRVDDAGNVLGTGYFFPIPAAPEHDYDPGPGVHNLTSSGGADVFILQLTQNGNGNGNGNGGGPGPTPTAGLSIIAVEPIAAETAAGEDPIHGVIRITRDDPNGTLRVKFNRIGKAKFKHDYILTVNGVPLTRKFVDIPDGQLSVDIVIEPVDDKLAEPDEVVTLVLKRGKGVTLPAAVGERRASVTIQDNEPVVSIEAIDAEAAEPGDDTAVLRISRTGSTAEPLTVKFRRKGSAKPGQDFVDLGKQITIPAGESFVDLVVQPLADTLVEPQETVMLTLLKQKHYHLHPVDVSATATIDDGPALAGVDLVALAVLDKPQKVSLSGNKPLRLSTLIGNAGGTDAGAFGVHLLLSSDRTPDAQDIVLADTDLAGLAAGQTQRLTGVVTASALAQAGVTAGEYFLIVVVDAHEQVAEDLEGNNVLVSSINSVRIIA